MGMKQSGVYHVTPVGTVKGLTVYCDMKTDGGGWLVGFTKRSGLYSVPPHNRVRSSGYH